MKGLYILYVLFILIVIIIGILYYNKKHETFNNNMNMNMNINDIEAFIYINLENRTDRKELLLNELKKINISENKIYKISGILKPKNGHKGCVQSHILALELAKLNKWKNVAIFEDDMELNVSPNKFITQINNALTKDWDVIILHGSYQESKENINNDLYYLKHSTQSTGYIIKESYYDTLLNLFKNCNNNMVDEHWTDIKNKWEPYALDQQWNKLIEKNKWIGFKTNLIKQRNISSSINY